MSKQKQVQISETLFVDLYCLSYDLLRGLVDKDKIKEVNKLLTEKLDKMITREVFTKYKTSAGGSDEREAARKEYLERIGIHQDWISKSEVIP